MFSRETISHLVRIKTLTKAFEEITGIRVNHQLLGEGRSGAGGADPDADRT